MSLAAARDNSELQAGQQFGIAASEAPRSMDMDQRFSPVHWYPEPHVHGILLLVQCSHER